MRLSNETHDDYACRESFTGMKPVKVPESENLTGWLLHRAIPEESDDHPYKTQCSCGRWFYIFDCHIHGVWSGEHADQFDDYPFPLDGPVSRLMGEKHTEDEIAVRKREQEQFDSETDAIIRSGGVWGPVDTRFASLEAITEANSNLR